MCVAVWCGVLDPIDKVPQKAEHALFIIGVLQSLLAYQILGVGSSGLRTSVWFRWGRDEETQ